MGNDVPPGTGGLVEFIHLEGDPLPHLDVGHGGIGGDSHHQRMANDLVCHWHEFDVVIQGPGESAGGASRQQFQTLLLTEGDEMSDTQSWLLSCCSHSSEVR